jgi:ABC-type nitrate/sulfonate/bicarbonate transport system substrate-binding protein
MWTIDHQGRAAASSLLSLAAACILACAQPACADDVPIRIAFPSGMNAQVVIAMQKAEIAEKAGLKPEYTPFQYGPPMMEALASGALDAVVTSLMPVTSYAAKVPGDIKIVAMVGQSSHSLLVAKDSPISSADALAGKTIGVSYGSDSHLDLLIWLKEQNLDGKVTLANVEPAELAASLASKSVDAIVIRQPQVLRLQQQTGAKALHSWPFRFVSILRTKFIADHPKEAAAYVTALREAVTYVAQNHAQSAKWFGEYLRTDPSIIEQVSGDDPSYNGDPAKIDISVKPGDRALIAKWSEDAFAQGMIKKKLDPAQLFQN